MKLLMFQARHFSFDHPTAPQHANEPEDGYPDASGVTVAFIHAEAHDPSREARLLRHAAKNIKWMTNKRPTRRVVLHSFAHLADTRAPTDFAQGFLATLQARLRRTGYLVTQTPYGISIAWQLAVYPEAVAKVFKSL